MQRHVEWPLPRREDHGAIPTHDGESHAASFTHYPRQVEDKLRYVAQHVDYAFRARKRINGADVGFEGMGRRGGASWSRMRPFILPCQEV